MVLHTWVPTSMTDWCISALTRSSSRSLPLASISVAMCERRSRVWGSTVWYSSSMPRLKDGCMVLCVSKVRARICGQMLYRCARPRDANELQGKGTHCFKLAVYSISASGCPGAFFAADFFAAFLAGAFLAAAFLAGGAGGAPGGAVEEGRSSERALAGEAPEPSRWPSAPLARRSTRSFQRPLSGDPRQARDS